MVKDLTPIHQHNTYARYAGDSTRDLSYLVRHHVSDILTHFARIKRHSLLEITLNVELIKLDFRWIRWRGEAHVGFPFNPDWCYQSPGLWWYPKQKGPPRSCHFDADFTHWNSQHIHLTDLGIAKDWMMILDWVIESCRVESPFLEGRDREMLAFSIPLVWLVYKLWLYENG